MGKWNWKVYISKKGKFNSHELRLLNINYWSATGNNIKTDSSNSIRWEEF